MNHICRIVWSETKACWQVVCEADDDSYTANCPEDHSVSCRVSKQKGCASGAVKARLAFYFLLGFRKHGRCFAFRRITSGPGIRSIGVDWRRKSIQDARQATFAVASEPVSTASIPPKAEPARSLASGGGSVQFNFGFNQVPACRGFSGTPFSLFKSE